MIETEYFLMFSKAHLEVLHLLHNSIQKKYFGCERGYDYRIEKKGIRWDKALWASANITHGPTDPS
jgi:hypothetical protein